MFTVRTLFVETGRVESGEYELTPSGEQAQQVCNLFLEYLSHRPPQFRDRLGFLTKGSFELDWSAAPGGAAFAALYEGGEPLSMSVLLSGVHPEVDQQMLEALRTTVIESARPDEAAVLAASPERPLLLNAVFPGAPEHTPTLQLLAAALASVYFRAILQIHRDERNGSEKGS